MGLIDTHGILYILLRLFDEILFILSYVVGVLIAQEKNSYRVSLIEMWTVHLTRLREALMDEDDSWTLSSIEFPSSGQGR